MQAPSIASSPGAQPRVWVDGRRADQGPAIPALDHGITVGDGVFETAKIVNGEVFALTRHHDRMDRSLAGLGLQALDRARVQEGIDAVLADGPIAFGRLRYTVTAGQGPLGSDRMNSPMTYIVTAGEIPLPPASTTVTIVPWTRNERSATVGLKTTSYADNVVALAAAKRLGGTEAIFTNTAGLLCEGSGSNIFLVKDGVVSTPALSTGPLAGITRALTIEWLAEAGIEVREEEVKLDALATADEAWLTSSTRDIQAISGYVVLPQPARPPEMVLVGEQTSAPTPGPFLYGGAAPPIEARTIGVGIGEVTAQAQEVFARLGRERMDP